ncbi:MAG: alpha/beta hydrolase [Clostridiales bacterium]|nr:alpha/beta hydrolase [Clostridiales bacterium]
MSNGIELSKVTTDKFTMNYMKFGCGSKTMVIVPGLSVDSVMKYADAVAGAYAPMTEDFAVYLFDRRSDLPSTYSIQDMADDTAAAISKLGLKDIYLFGASQGGMISMVIALDHPELVSKLILGSTAARVDQEHFSGAITHWINLAAAKDAEGLYLSFGEALYPPEVYEQSKDVLKQCAAGVTEDDMARFVILAKGISGFDVSSRVKGISCPVLVLGSEDDKVLGGDASREIYEVLSSRADCDIHMYTGFGHAVYDLAPDYKERMTEFFLR